MGKTGDDVPIEAWAHYFLRKFTIKCVDPDTCTSFQYYTT